MTAVVSALEDGSRTRAGTSVGEEPAGRRAQVPGPVGPRPV